MHYKSFFNVPYALLTLLHDLITYVLINFFPLSVQIYLDRSGVKSSPSEAIPTKYSRRIDKYSKKIVCRRRAAVHFIQNLFVCAERGIPKGYSVF